MKKSYVEFWNIANKFTKKSIFQKSTFFYINFNVDVLQIAYRVLQRDQNQRDIWRIQIYDWKFYQFMFFDETTICKRIDNKKYNWIQQNKKIVVFSLFVKFEKWFILSTYVIKNYII